MNIYKITNKINGKCYVGLTKFTIEKRFSKHKTEMKSDRVPKLYRSMRKYGFENFKIELIDTAKTIEELGEKEIYWIAKLETVKNGYNILRGGFDVKTDNGSAYWTIATEESIQKFKDDHQIAHQGLKKSKNPTSKFKGVHKLKENQWVSSIWKREKNLFRVFETEEEAAAGYDKFALYLYGSTAKTNFPNTYTEEEIKSFVENPIKKRRSDTKYPSKYKYISYSPQSKRWSGKLKRNKKMLITVFGATEEETYKKFMDKIKELNIDLNAPFRNKI